MPYITQGKRAQTDTEIDALIAKLQKMGLGDAVYAVYRLLTKLYGNKDSFTVKAQALSVLQAVELEYYRKVIAPYEDKKIQENGEITI